MRSLLFTVLLILSTVILGTLAIWQLREGSLERLFGTNSTPVGGRIYPDFQPREVTTISIKAGEKRAEFVKTATGWHGTSPWQDRMDPRAALALLTFANTTIVEDMIPRDKLKPTLAGFDGGGTEINLTAPDEDGSAYFRLGRRTPLFNLPNEENPEPVPTTYLLPLERGRKSHVYAATGDILPLFKDGFRFLRDHRPFYFNPLGLQRIRLRTPEGELTLGRAAPDSPWRIVKPLDLPTDPAAVKELLEGIFNLQASTLSDRSEVTLPSSAASAESRLISITSFGSETETVLEILPPVSTEAREAQATVSDRPNTLFTLPLRSEQNLTSLSDLPLTVNDLRDPTLTNLNIASIRGIAIESATSPTILVSREPPAPWLATVNGSSQPANEQRLFDLLKAATETRALSFETDAAPEDLSPWGLDRPILTLTFLAENNQALSLSFGLDIRGGLFAKRRDSQTIMRLDNRFLEKIAIRPHDWRHARLWSLSRVDLTSLTRTEPDSPALTLNYDFLGESWRAFKGETEVTSTLDPARATFLLGVLENLQVTRWLSPADESAAAALQNPTLTFELTENMIDDSGETSGKKTEALSLALDTSNQVIYGKLTSDPSPFILAPEAYVKLNIPLLDQ